MTSPSSSSITTQRVATSPEPLWTRNFIVGTLVNFTLCCNYFMLMVVMTAYALDVYQADAALAALCASIFIIGTLVARFLTPLLMARIRARTLLLVGDLVIVALTSLYLVGVSLELMLVLRFAHGLAYGVCSTAIATVVTALVPHSRKGEGIGYYMLSVTLGAAIGPFLGIFLANNISYDVLFIAAASVALASALCALVLRPRETSGRSTVASAKRAEEEAEDEIAGAIADAPVEEAREEARANRPEQKASAAEPKSTGLYRFIEPKVVPISFVAFLIFFGYSGLLTFLTPYATELGLSRAASVFFVVYAISMFVTRPFTGRTFDRKGPRIVMIPAFISFAAGMVMLAFASNDWMILGSALLLGFGVGTVQSTGLAIAVRETADDRLSVTNATFYMLLDVGVGVGPLILGIVVPLVGYSLMYIGMAVIGLAAGVIFMIQAHNRRKRRTAS